MKNKEGKLLQEGEEIKKGGPNTAGSCTKRIRRQNKERR
mgnify:CR=1 FL=1